MAPAFLFHILGSILDHQSYDKYKSQGQDGFDEPHCHRAIQLMIHLLPLTIH